MLHADDLISLHRLLGDHIPQNVQDEVELVTHLYHSDGNHGRIGTLGCIDILRRLGLCNEIPKLRRKLEAIDFHRVKLGRELWVLRDGKWRHGHFTGTLPQGLIAVHLDGDGGSVDARPIDCSYDPPAPEPTPEPETEASIWSSVPLESEVLVEIDDVLTPGKLKGVDETGLAVKLKGSKTVTTFPESAVTLAR